MNELHWLPVHKRIDFKVLPFVFKCINGLAPNYLADIIKPYHVARVTRSSTDPYLLHIPKCNSKTYGDTQFAVAGPRLWNSLPFNLRIPMSLDCFKNRLKTHLFKL